MQRRLQATGYGIMRHRSWPKRATMTRTCHQLSPSHHNAVIDMATYLVPLYPFYVYHRLWCSRIYINILSGRLLSPFLWQGIEAHCVLDSSSKRTLDLSIYLITYLLGKGFKYLAYGRHWISQCVRILKPIEFFLNCIRETRTLLCRLCPKQVENYYYVRKVA